MEEGYASESESLVSLHNPDRSADPVHSHEHHTVGHTGDWMKVHDATLVKGGVGEKRQNRDA